MAGIGGYNGWRWIFILEGLATVVLAVFAKFFIVDWPETSKFLNVEERQLLLRRLSEDVEQARMDRLDNKARRRIFGDWKIYTGYAMDQPNCCDSPTDGLLDAVYLCTLVLPILAIARHSLLPRF